MKKISFRDDVLPLKNELFRLALRITLDKAEAEDIVQETMIKVWNRREDLAGIDSVEAFCLKQPHDGRPYARQKQPKQKQHQTVPTWPTRPNRPN